MALRPFTGKLDSSVAAEPEDVGVGDYLRQIGGGAAQALGSGVRGIAEGIMLPARGADPLVDVSALGRLGDSISSAGQRLSDGVSETARQRMAGSTPTGELFKPGTWSLGADPSLSGYALQASNVLGQVVPMAAVGIATKGKMVPATLTGMAVGGGAAAQGEQQRIEQMNAADLANLPGYQSRLAKGMDAATARADLAAAAGHSAFRHAAPLGAADALTHVLPFTAGAQRALARAVGPGRIARTAAGALGGAVGEGTQEVLEQAAQTIGGDVATGEQRNPMQDSFQQAVLGAIGGAPVAAAAGALTSPATAAARLRGEEDAPLARTAPVEVETTVVDPGDGPLSKAVAEEAAVASGTPVQPVQVTTQLADSGALQQQADDQVAAERAKPRPTRPGELFRSARTRAEQAQARTVPESPAPAPELVDTETGEIRKATPADIRARLEPLANGPINSTAIKVIARQLGVPVIQVSSARAQMRREQESQSSVPDFANFEEAQDFELERSRAAGGSEKWQKTPEFAEFMRKARPFYEGAAKPYTDEQAATNAASAALPQQENSDERQIPVSGQSDIGAGTEQRRTAGSDQGAAVQEGRQEGVGQEAVQQAGRKGRQEGVGQEASKAPLTYDESPEPLDGDITTPSGGTFSARGAADLAARRTPNAKVIPMEDGTFAVRLPTEKPDVVSIPEPQAESTEGAGSRSGAATVPAVAPAPQAETAAGEGAVSGAQAASVAPKSTRSAPAPATIEQDGKLTYDRNSTDTAAAYYRKGSTIADVFGQARVESFKRKDDGTWTAKLLALGKDGNPRPGAKPREVKTLPAQRTLEAHFGVPTVSGAQRAAKPSVGVQAAQQPPVAPSAQQAPSAQASTPAGPVGSGVQGASPEPSKAGGRAASATKPEQDVKSALPRIVKTAVGVKALRTTGMTAKQARDAFDALPRGVLKEGTRARADVQAAIDAATKPAATATHADPGKPAEPVSTGVVTDAMKKAAKDRRVTLNAAKQSLLSQIDAEIKKAPKKELPLRPRDGYNTRESGNSAGNNWNRYERQLDAIGYVTFDIPGDGKFRVLKTKQRLTEFRKKVAASAGFRSTAKQSVPSKPSTSSTKGAAKSSAARFVADREYANAVRALDEAGISTGFGNSNRTDEAVIYANAESVSIPFLDDTFVGESLEPQARKSRDEKWCVIERNTGLAIGRGLTKGSAVKAAIDAVNKAGKERVTSKFKDANKVSQESLRARIMGGEGISDSTPEPKQERRMDSEGRAAVESAEDPQAEIARLRKEANTDALTGLKNRRALDREGADMFHVAIDLTLFKGYNTMLGDVGGDAVLKVFGEAMLEIAPENAYRRGGDEFTITTASVEAAQGALNALQRRAAEIELTIEGSDGKRYIVTGVPFRAGVGEDEEKAIRNRDENKTPGDRNATPDNVRAADAAGSPEARSESQDRGRQAPARAKAAKADVKSSSTPAIENFGEALPQRKRNRGASLDKELIDSEIAGQPLSKTWPKAEIDAIEDVTMAAIASTARSLIPSKPKKAYRLKSWTENVQRLRSLVKTITDGDITNQELLERVRTEGRALEGFAAKVPLLSSLDRTHWGRIGDVREHPDAYRYSNGTKEDAPFVSVGVDGRNQVYEGASSVADVVERVSALLDGVQKPKAKPMEFEIRGNRKTDKYFINKKGDSEYRKLKLFDSVADANAYLENNHADLVKAWDAVKERDNVGKGDVRNAENRPRTGADHRNGKDATPAMFEQTFGFRGVEFGKWVSQGGNVKERQGLLNETYDALLDLAEIVNVPSQAISLNGTLGLGLGSRGSGWSSAHFEPNNMVINLTKTRGSGSLAHEWFHALDNYFARSRGGEKPFTGNRKAYREQNFITYRPEPMMVHRNYGATSMAKADLERLRKENPKNRFYFAENWIVDPNHPQGVRPQVEEAFADVVKTLNESPMAARARRNDKGPDGYWSQIIERGARSFENYVISKMMEKGYQNDFLASVTTVDVFRRDPERYPYLKPEEVAPVAEAFDALFGTLETRTDAAGKVGLFSRPDQSRPRDPTRFIVGVNDLRRHVDRIASQWKGDIPLIRSIESARELPNEARRQTGWERAEGWYDGRGTIYLVANNLGSLTRASQVLAHEAIGHYGVEGVVGKEQWTQIVGDVARLRKNRAGLSADMRGAMDSAERRYAGENSSTFAREFIAIMAERGVKSSLVARVLAAVRRWLRAAGFKIDAWADASMREILSKGMRQVAVNGRTRADGQRGYAMSRPETGLFSRPDTLMDAIGGMMGAGDETVMERLKGKISDWKPGLLATLTMRQLAEVTQKYLPSGNAYIEVNDRMTARRNELQNLDSKTAAKWEQMQTSDRRKSTKQQLVDRDTDSDRTVDLMHDSTIAGVDGAEKYQVTYLTLASNNQTVSLDKASGEAAIAELNQRAAKSGALRNIIRADIRRIETGMQAEAQRAAAYPELQRRFAKLPKPWQDLYREVRNSYSRRADMMLNGLLARIDALEIEGREKKKLREQVRANFEAARVEAPYFPLARFGDYWVTLERVENGEKVQQFVMAETQRERDRAVKVAEAAGWKAVKKGKKIENVRAQDGASGTFIADVVNTLETRGVKEQVRDEIYQLYLRTLPDLSTRKHFIHRKKVAGYAQDALRAYSGQMLHGAHQLSKLEFGPRLEAALQDIVKEAKAAQDSAGDDADKASDAASEFKKRHEWVLNPTSATWAQKLSQLNFVFYLGLTPAASLINLTQTAIVTYPALASRFGVMKALNMTIAAMRQAISRAAKDTGGVLSAAAKGQVYDGEATLGMVAQTDDERRAYKDLLALGAIDVTQSHDLAGLGDTDTRDYNATQHRVMNVISYLFHKAEVVNREATAMATYRLAREAGQGHDASVKLAADTIWQTHFDYSNANRSRIMQGDAAKVLFAFKQYSQSITYYLWRAFYEATKGDTPEVKEMARNRLLGTVGMTGVFAGAMGMPTLSVMFLMANAMHSAFGDDDEPWDAETEFRNFLVDMFGQKLGRIAQDGLVEGGMAALGLKAPEIGSRVSLDQLWVRSPDPDLEGKDLYTHLLEQVAGPIAGMFGAGITGAGMVSEGLDTGNKDMVWRGIEKAMPKAARDGMKALRYGTQGINTMRGDPLVADSGLLESVYQGLGFMPSDVSLQYEVNASAKMYEKRIQDRKGSLMDAYALAVRNHDTEAARDVLAKMREFSKKYPALAIKPNSIRRSLQSRQSFSERAVNGVSLSPNLADKINDRIRFGD